MQVTKNDYGYLMEFTIYSDTNVVYDLTSHTVKLIGNNGLEETLTITDAENGQCRYLVQENDFDEIGNFKYQIQVSSGTKRISSLSFIIEVLDEIS